MMERSAKFTTPPDDLYLAVNVWLPGLRPARGYVALPRMMISTQVSDRSLSAVTLPLPPVEMKLMNAELTP